MKKYEKYKQSGVQWLGEVPEHWEAVGISKLFSLKAGGDLQPNFFSREKDDEHPFPIYTNANNENAIYGYTSQKRFNANSITVSGRGYIGFAAYRDHDFDAIIRLLVLSPLKELNCKYYTYSINALLDFKFESSAVAQLSTVQLAQYKLLLPPLEEQTAIADFLDNKLGEIDLLIGKQQNLLEKLAEQRTATITTTVTKGLNPNAPMKQSGVEWLGEVPEHWETMPVKFSLAMPITDGPHETPEILTEGIPFLSAEAVKNDKLDFDKKRGYISEEDNARFSKKYSPLKGDIYMVKSGATTGNVAKVETDEIFNIWSPLAVMRPNKNKISTDFLFYAIKSDYFNTSVRLKWNMGTQQNIGMGVISNIRIFVPPLEEQTIIADYLDKETAKIDRLCDTVNQTINRLQEYRTALITQVVTGKIKVV